MEAALGTTKCRFRINTRRTEIHPIMLKTGEMIDYLFTPILLYIFLVITFKYLFSLRNRLPLPPGPFSWPLIGNLFQVDLKRPHAALAKLAQAHGPDLMSIRFGTRLVVVASSRAAAAEVLKTNDRMLSGRYVACHIRVKGSRLHNLSTGLLEECDEYWKSIRTIYRAELFSTKALESQVSMRENKVTEMIQHLAKTQLGQVIKIRDVVFVTALNVLGNLILSTDLIDFEGKGVGERMKKDTSRYTMLAATPQLADLYPILGLFSKDFQGTYKKLMVLFDKICDVWTGIVQDRRNRDSQPSLGSMDFADALVKNGYTDTQIDALLVETFGAGTESTTATSEWMLVELLRNRQALQKLKDELEEVVGGKNVIRESDLPNLPYLEACFKETLRLHPPGPLLLPHRAVQTCEVMGYRIPKDTQVMVNMWAIARDPKNWDYPSSFKPERFLNSKMDYIGRYFEYIPFGSGRRMCAGQPLASRFVPLVVASLIHEFDWFLPNDIDSAQIDMDEILDITMFKNDPLLVIPKLRKRA
ncbi:probable (S)-N-methylcoclaurine 3'-hydroxylase isozyme 2 [Lycium barbarum]|uniref:probable (S)-N-methylcoclaurine 3'-hydroxylase isozyme 2 n=1 Tax=Lycium barbarum TaxID=112863 RepID=UPI00293E85D9|nr:probable (S)-N-methylcoclaurine 3'-hydroxylase isozyme 2 [Lycium barbarum]